MLSVIKPVTITESGISDLWACRACLATDIKLYDLQLVQLRQAFTDLTAIPVLEMDGLPHHICSFCRALLVKFSAFRAQCHQAHVLWEDARIQLQNTCYNTRKIDRTNLKLQLKIIKLTEMNIEPNNATISLIDELNYPNNATISLIDDLNYPNNATISLIDDLNYEGNILLPTNKHSNSDKTLDNDKHCAEIEYLDNDSNIKATVEKLPDTIELNSIEIDHCDVKDELDDFDRESIKIVGSVNGSAKHESNVTFDFVDTGQIADNKNVKPSQESDDSDNAVLQEYKTKAKGKAKINNLKSKKMTAKITKTKEEIKNEELQRICTNAAKKINCRYVSYTKEEQIQAVLARKDSFSYKNARFKCDECYKVFFQESSFKNHKDGHEPSMGSHVCDICRLRFPTNQRLSRHKGRHRQRYICNECGHISEQRCQATMHFKFHSGFQYECKDCGKKYSKSSSYLNHVRINHGETACDICGEKFIGDKGLNAHLNKSHREALKCMCKTCGVRFQSATALARHTEGLCLSGNRACAACGDSFASEDLLNDHFQLQHKVHGKTYKCEVCEKTYNTEKNLSHHWINRHGPAESSYNRYKRTQAQVPANETKSPKPYEQRNNSYMCEVCGKSFPMEAKLRYHQRLHTGEKPFQCPLCPKSFRMSLNLKVHMPTHTGARQYKCSFCPKAFKTYAHRVVHLRSHTKEKPYTCSACHKGFQTGGTLKEHVTTIHMGQARRQRDRHKDKTNK